MRKREEVKEEEPKEEVKPVVDKPKKQVYKISPAVLEKGYSAKIDNQTITIHKTLKTRDGQTVKDAWIEVQEGYDPKTGKPIMKTVSELTDITDEQFRQLTIAKVIILTPEQEKIFGRKFYGKK